MQCVFGPHSHFSLKEKGERGEGFAFSLALRER